LHRPGKDYLIKRETGRKIFMDKFEMIERGLCNGASGTCAKLHVTDWLNDVKNIVNPDEIVEVRFKNTRKDYYRNVNDIKLVPGDIVAVEASPGHDIGIVSLTGDLVFEQMKKHKVTLVDGDFRKIYRKAKQVDIDKWREAISLEHTTMIKSRQISADLRLNMKIGDVEYQGDCTKAIFYYIADERVDFRQLIKVLAESFHIRIEMKQIGARQEAGRIGGIGPCGRELCCATWVGSFVSVTTNSARYQDISLNPQKLAGQCGKLKCCLNYEVDAYIDAQKNFPPNNIPLHTDKGTYFFQKADIFNGIYWYALQNEGTPTLIPVPVDKVKQIIRMNKDGKRPDNLKSEDKPNKAKEEQFENVVGQDDLNRFDNKKSKHPRRKKHFIKKGPHPKQNEQ
jgi:cell fate regulator YaaT (PSP1 superfamily)